MNQNQLREALQASEVAIANLVSYQSTSNTPSIHEFGQALRALEKVRAALSQPAQEGAVAHWVRTHRVFHEYENSAKEDTEGYLTTSFSAGPKRPIGDGWEPLYTTPPASQEHDADTVPRAKYNQLLMQEHELSDAYVRLRQIIDAMDPPSVSDSKALWSYVEGVARQKIAASQEQAQQPTPAAVPEAMGDEQIIRAAVSALPNTNPLVADDLIGGHTMHTEAEDIVAIWKAGAEWQALRTPTQPCGHPASLVVRSAESGEPLYCEACDDKSGRRDAESREVELSTENKTLRNEISALRTAGAVPDGWRLVPVEPTDAMVQAAFRIDLSYMPGQEGADRAAVYRAMLTAAPPAPKDGREVVPWSGDNLDDIVESFDRITTAYTNRAHPFHDPIATNAQIALRFLRGYLPFMKCAAMSAAQAGGGE